MIKFSKIPILLIVCLIIITGAFGLFMLIDKDDEKVSVIAFNKAFTVNIYGTEGEGYVDIEYNDDYIGKFYDKDGNVVTKEHIQLEVSKANNLYNNDQFTVSISNSSSLKENGIKFNKSSETYTVKGLKIGTDYDVFKDFKIYIDEDEVMLDNSGCANFVKDNVIFYIKNKLDSYNKGDTVFVGVYVDMNAATDNGYNIKVLEKEYVLTEQEKTND